MENNENEIKTENLSDETSVSSTSPNAESVNHNDLASTEDASPTTAETVEETEKSDLKIDDSVSETSNDLAEEASGVGETNADVSGETETSANSSDENATETATEIVSENSTETAAETAAESSTENVAENSTEADIGNAAQNVEEDSKTEKYDFENDEYYDEDDDEFLPITNNSETQNGDISAQNDAFSTQNGDNLQNLDSQNSGDIQSNQNESEPPSIFVIYFNSLKERMCFVNAMVYTGLISLVSLFGSIFFGKVRLGFVGDINMENSCKVLMVFFIIVFVMVFALFVFSIVMNIKRIRADRETKKHRDQK